MVKSRQRKQENELIIRSEIKWMREITIFFFSLIMWIYCAAVIFYFVSALLNFNDSYISQLKTSFKMTNMDIQSFMLLALIMWLAFYVGLWIWKFYNQKRFGSLDRRTYPLPTTKEDLLNLQLINEKDYDTLQQSKMIVFERNPIRDIKK
ncbi:hypothetical protein [Peribacillus frigoritolerans]|uniref:hypothetical protein n=1 Tax=Peribacillus frigoritolerans TaxID=450367 RepID=UPI00105A9FB9|nr:hypothetical protein [Peribacillus frigoritolerans]TDL76093.1 hypothetical protein E2R53_20510 [Peribacillus frigoritolerans]